VSVLDFIISFVGITVMFGIISSPPRPATLRWKMCWVRSCSNFAIVLSIGKLVNRVVFGHGANRSHSVRRVRLSSSCFGRTILHKSSSLVLSSLACMQCDSVPIFFRTQTEFVVVIRKVEIKKSHLSRRSTHESEKHRYYGVSKQCYRANTGRLNRDFMS